MTASRARPAPRRLGGYPRAFRLRRKDDIQHAQRRGVRRGTPWFTVCVLPNALGHPRFGFAVSRKVGNAVVRNKVKRRLREVYRHVRPHLAGLDVMVLARPSAAQATLIELDRALRAALDLPIEA